MIDENLQSVQMSVNDIKEALRNNPVFFMQFFMHEHLTKPIPQFHIDVFQKMVTSDVQKLALALPRGHNKTTLAKLAVVYYFLFHPQSFIIYVSNTSEVAQNACRDIAAFLTSHNFVSVFGPVQKEMWREGEGFYIFKIGNKRCILRALGAGQQVRGLNVDNIRPEMGVVDDLEDDENTATPILQKKLKNWVYGAFFKAFNRWRYKFIWLGNMLTNTSLLHEHCNDPAWHSWRLGCLLKDGTPLWPDLWPLEAIKADFEDYRKKNILPKWFAEMMNLPLPEGGAVIDASEINYKPAIMPGDIEYGFITIDPAIGMKTASDNTGIAVHGWVGSRWQIVETYKAKLDPKLTFEIAMSLCTKWGVKIVGIETQAYQAALMFFFEYLLKTMGDTDTQVVQLKASGRKSERIFAWAAMLKNKEYAINEGEFNITEQLLNFDPAKVKNDDDLIDACAYGVQMIYEYSSIIMASVLKMPLEKSTGTYKVCAI